MAWQSRFDDLAYSTDKRCSGNENEWAPQSLSLSSRRTSKKEVNSRSNQICDLTNETTTSNLLGLIISREGPKSFFSKKGASSGTERHLISFTLRDDPESFINITCWGGGEFIARLSEHFKVGDVVEVKGAQVQAKSKNPSDEKFKPWTPSSFCLNLSEDHGEFNFYGGIESDYLVSLLNLPTRASNDYYTLEDIEANGMNLHNEHINIFALVKKVWPKRDLITKTGKKITKVDVILCDETCPAFQLTLWDSFVCLSENWKPLQTVLFGADVKIAHSDFHSTMVASSDSRTIITVDPDTAEAQSLGSFGRSQLTDTDLEQTGNYNIPEGNRDPEISSITNVMTVEEVKNEQKELISTMGEKGFGVVYAFLSHFDIDADNSSIVRNVCSQCHRHLDSTYVCKTPDCNGREMSSDAVPLVEYSVSVSLTDSSGTLQSCFVAPHAIEKLLQISPLDFQITDQVLKTKLKWNYLFERMKAVVKFTGAASGKTGKSFVRVMALEKPEVSEVLQECFLTN